jgi:peptidylprolyl isomerase
MLRVAMIALLALSLLVVLTGCPKPAAEVPTTPAPDAAAPAPEAATPEVAKPETKPEGKEESKVKVEGEEGKPVEKTASGLQYVVLDPGTGAKPSKGDKVVAEYTGWLTDGTKFDSSKDHPGDFEFNVGAGNVIPGWDEAFSDMKEGERRKLIIPSDLGYGAEGTPGGPIPPNATLIFEVKLVKIVK